MNDLHFTIIGILIPFVGTAIGTLPTLFIKKFNDTLKSMLFGFSAGVMLAASIWSLLLPALNSEQNSSFIQTIFGYFLGIVLMLSIDILTAKNQESKWDSSKKAALAITVHNLPEGMAVGIALCSALSGNLPYAPALILALGVAIQNIPEGAIVSMPLGMKGMNKWKAIFVGVLSGAVEIVGALLAILNASIIASILPLSLAFAAGAMHFVTFKELFPEASSTLGVLFCALGFAAMMSLDVLLG